MNIRPQDLPELRAEVAAWHAQYGTKYFTSCIKAGAQTVYRPDLSTAAEGRRLATTEAQRLAETELFWVSREMTELCVAAARSMPAWSLQPEDLPAPAGFLYFEGLPEFRPEFPTTAMTWGPCPADVASFALKGPGIWLSHYVGQDWFAKHEELDLTSMRTPLAPLVYDGESIAAFGERETGDVSFAADDGEVVEVDDQTLISRCSSLVVVKAACLLMQQELAEAETVEPDRAARKRLRRQGAAEDARTRVINLRRPSGSSGGTSDREYHHQWIVRGHWRQHWFPKRQVHRPVWIAPHVKGPEGAPLIGGEKVYALKR